MRFVFLVSPRKSMLRKILFQLHLWLGLVLSLYVVVIGLSGATLVFQDEIRRTTLPHQSYAPNHRASISTVLAQAKPLSANERLTYIAFPQRPSPWWVLYFTKDSGTTRAVYADAVTGHPFANRGRQFIDWVEDLHIYLLSGRTGFQVNCAMGISLLLVTLSGIVLWWPGKKISTRDLFLRWNHGWKRMNYDLHRVVGFWTLLIVVSWSLTAIYFLFPAQVMAWIERISPLQGMRQPAMVAASKGTVVVALDEVLQNPAILHQGIPSGMAIPDAPGDNITVYVDREREGDFSHRDIDVVDGHTGKLLSCWHYGENKTLGDWLVWLVYPLHFGTLWGLPVKILWSTFGVCLAALSVTGILMYWNRFLSKQVKFLRVER